MIIGMLTIDFFCDRFHSLKDKRQVLSSMKQTLRQRFNVAVAESDFQDLWQKMQLSLVSLNHTRAALEVTFREIEDFLFDRYGLQPINRQVDFV
jgi:uncharacterized protein